MKRKADSDQQANPIEQDKLFKKPKLSPKASPKQVQPSTSQETELTPQLIQEKIIEFQGKISSVDKEFNQNIVLREKFASDPSKFLESEVSLFESLEDLQELPAFAFLFKPFVDQKAVLKVVSFLQHPNVNVAFSVLKLINEITSKSFLSDVEKTSGFEVIETFFNQLLASNFFFVVMDKWLISKSSVDPNYSKFMNDEQNLLFPRIFESDGISLLEFFFQIMENVCDHDDQVIHIQLLEQVFLKSFALTTSASSRTPEKRTFLDWIFFCINDFDTFKLFKKNPPFLTDKSSQSQQQPKKYVKLLTELPADKTKNASEWYEAFFDNKYSHPFRPSACDTFSMLCSMVKQKLQFFSEMLKALSNEEKEISQLKGSDLQKRKEDLQKEKKELEATVIKLKNIQQLMYTPKNLDLLLKSVAFLKDVFTSVPCSQQIEANDAKKQIKNNFCHDSDLTESLENIITALCCCLSDNSVFSEKFAELEGFELFLKMISQQESAKIQTRAKNMLKKVALKVIYHELQQKSVEENPFVDYFVSLSGIDSLLSIFESSKKLGKTKGEENLEETEELLNFLFGILVTMITSSDKIFQKYSKNLEKIEELPQDIQELLERKQGIFVNLLVAFKDNNFAHTKTLVDKYFVYFFQKLSKFDKEQIESGVLIQELEQAYNLLEEGEKGEKLEEEFMKEQIYMLRKTEGLKILQYICIVLGWISQDEDIFKFIGKELEKNKCSLKIIEVVLSETKEMEKDEFESIADSILKTLKDWQQQRNPTKK